MIKIWRSIVAWFEQGDLVPLLVIVSAVHYAAVLAGKDHWTVAIAIGVLVDLGHYRWVRAAARYTGAARWELATRWAWAILFTGMSLAYHERYYADLWLSAPMPLLIASLAWLQARTVRRGAQETTQEPARSNAYVCRCGRSFERQQGLAAHMRVHVRRAKEEKANV